MIIAYTIAGQTVTKLLQIKFIWNSTRHESTSFDVYNLILVLPFSPPLNLLSLPTSLHIKSFTTEFCLRLIFHNKFECKHFWSFMVALEFVIIQVVTSKPQSTYFMNLLWMAKSNRMNTSCYVTIELVMFFGPFII